MNENSLTESPSLNKIVGIQPESFVTKGKIILAVQGCDRKFLESHRLGE